MFQMWVCPLMHLPPFMHLLVMRPVAFPISQSLIPGRRAVVGEGSPCQRETTNRIMGGYPSTDGLPLKTALFWLLWNLKPIPSAVSAMLAISSCVAFPMILLRTLSQVKMANRYFQDTRGRGVGAVMARWGEGRGGVWGSGGPRDS